jgi:hypothetical protein
MPESSCGIWIQRRADEALYGEVPEAKVLPVPVVEKVHISDDSARVIIAIIIPSHDG